MNGLIALIDRSSSVETMTALVGACCTTFELLLRTLTPAHLHNFTLSHFHTDGIKPKPMQKLCFQPSLSLRPHHTRFCLASLPGFWMQILISLHGPHGHDRQPNYPSQPVVQCLLLWPHFSRISSHLVIDFWPLERFAPCFLFF